MSRKMDAENQRNAGRRGADGRSRRVSTDQRLFTQVAAILLALLAVGHVFRFVFGVELIVAGMIIPVGASIPFAMIAAGVAWMVWREVRDLS